MPRPAPPVALTIAGSDCSSGAGVQADLKSFTAHAVYGLTVVTCVVAEVPGQVVSIQALPAKSVCEQMKLLLKTFPIRAIKTGMLHSSGVLEGVAEVCAEYWQIPLVIDPVMVASNGHELLPKEVVDLYVECLFPLAALVTPNLDEARVLLPGEPINTLSGMRAAGAELCSVHETAFLMKGGHLGDTEEAIDLLCLPDDIVHDFRAPFTRGVPTHGTGCTYSAAITALLAHGLDLPNAVAQAKRYVTATIRDSFRWEHGTRTISALNHSPHS